MSPACYAGFRSFHFCARPRIHTKLSKTPCFLVGLTEKPAKNRVRPGLLRPACYIHTHTHIEIYIHTYTHTYIHKPHTNVFSIRGSMHCVVVLLLKRGSTHVLGSAFRSNTCCSFSIRGSSNCQVFFRNVAAPIFWLKIRVLFLKRGSTHFWEAPFGLTHVTVFQVVVLPSLLLIMSTHLLHLRSHDNHHDTSSATGCF